MNFRGRADREAGPTAVRVGHLTGEATDALCSLAVSLGMDCIRIDLDGCRDRGGLLDRTAAACGFPDWFGRNWDALFDCLTDLSWRPASGYLLLFEHADELQQHDRNVLDTVVGILDDAARDWHERGKPLRAYVSCDGVR